MSKNKNAIWKWKKTKICRETNVSVLCLCYLSLELKEMIRRKEEKLVKSKRKVSCFGCHFKIKNFTMSTCLLLLLCPPKYDYNFFREIVFFTEKSWNTTYVEKKKTFTRPYTPIIMPPYVYCRPLPLIAAMSSTYICIIKKLLPFSELQNTEIIFLSRILTLNIYALSLNPQKKKNLRGLSTWKKEKKTSKKKCLLMKNLLSADVWKKKKSFKTQLFLPCSRATSSEEE